MGLIYAAVHPGLFIRGHLKGRRLEAKERLVYDLDLRAICNVASAPDPDHLLLGVTYGHFPLVDGPHIREEALMKAVDFTLKHLEGDGSVLVHCDGGRNRAGLVAALVIRELTGCSGADAFHRVVEARRPTEALTNPVFVDFIHEYKPWRRTLR